jgi:hypothetical protein
MRGDIACRRGVAVSQQSSSLCLRYGRAKPSVWLRNSVRKLGRFNNFHSDYPLTISCSRLRNPSVIENSCGYWFLAWPSRLLHRHAVVPCRLQCLASISNYSSNDLAFSRLIVEALGKMFVREFASRFCLSPDAWCIALYKSCLQLQAKVCLTSDMVWFLVHAGLGDPGRDLFSAVQSGPEQESTAVLSFVTWRPLDTEPIWL